MDKPYGTKCICRNWGVTCCRYVGKRYTSAFELYILHKIISLFTRQETEKYVIFNYIPWYLFNRWEWLKKNSIAIFGFSIIIEIRPTVVVASKSSFRVVIVEKHLKIVFNLLSHAYRFLCWQFFLNWKMQYICVADNKGCHICLV